MRIVDVMQTTGQDWANHLSHGISGNGMLHLVALLTEKPDASMLLQAIKDLIELQPVLGCRFDETREPPVWAPVNDENGFRELHADTLRQGVDAISRRVWTQGRQLEVTLLTEPDQAAICLSFDHAATDGGGAKRCLELLSRCYQRRCEGRACREQLSLDRSDGQIYRHCSLPDYRMALKRETSTAEAIATVPYAGMDGRTVEYRWASLPLSAVKHSGGTMNDRLLAAYVLALARAQAEPRAVEIHITIDLRRYLEPAEAPLASNLSGMATVSLRVDPAASYSGVLAEVQRQTALLKAQHIGLSSAAMMTYLRTMPYAKAKGALLAAGKQSRASGMAAPILSNLGLIGPETLCFGASKVTNILPLLPALHAPAFILGACGYGDTLTISAGTYGEERPPMEVEKLLSDIRNLLENPC